MVRRSVPHHSFLALTNPTHQCGPPLGASPQHSRPYEPDPPLRFTARRLSTALSPFRTLKTPTEEIWPGVSDLPDYKPSFPNWTENQLADSVSGICADGLDLLQASGMFSGWLPGRGQELV